MPMDSDEEKELGNEFTLRNNFESKLQDALTGLEHILTQPSEAEALKVMTRTILDSHNWVNAFALVTLDQHQCIRPFIVHGTEAEILQVLCNSDPKFAEAITAVITQQRRGEYAHKGSRGQYRLASSRPIVGVEGRTALIVLVDKPQWVIESLVTTAAIFIGLFAGRYNLERAKARREAMSMMSHMCAGHIAVSRYHIEQVEKLFPNAPQSLVSNMQPHLSTATTELNNAGIALRKAAIWSSDDSPLTEEVCIEQELKCVVEQLQFGPFVDKSFEECLSNLRTIRIVAARSRLQQCLRDSLIGTWILSRRNSLGLHAEFKASDDGGKSVTLHICGKDSTIPSDWSDDRVKRTFFDPEIFFLTSTEEIEERALTFDCTRRLLRQMNADMVPSLDEKRRFRLAIHFTKCQT